MIRILFIILLSGPLAHSFFSPGKKSYSKKECINVAGRVYHPSITKKIGEYLEKTFSIPNYQCLFNSGNQCKDNDLRNCDTFFSVLVPGQNGDRPRIHRVYIPAGHNPTLSNIPPKASNSNDSAPIDGSSQ